MYYNMFLQWICLRNVEIHVQKCAVIQESVYIDLLSIHFCNFHVTWPWADKTFSHGLSGIFSIDYQHNFHAQLFWAVRKFKCLVFQYLLWQISCSVTVSWAWEKSYITYIGQKYSQPCYTSIQNTHKSFYNRVLV